MTSGPSIRRQDRCRRLDADHECSILVASRDRRCVRLLCRCLMHIRAQRRHACGPHALRSSVSRTRRCRSSAARMRWPTSPRTEPGSRISRRIVRRSASVSPATRRAMTSSTDIACCIAGHDALPVARDRVLSRSRGSADQPCCPRASSAIVRARRRCALAVRGSGLLRRRASRRACRSAGESSTRTRS